MKTLLQIFPLLSILVFPLSCGNTVPRTGQPQKQSENEMLKFKRFSCMDTQGTGMEAYNFLMPSDWKFEGGISWIPEQVAMPAVNRFRVYNPSGHEEFEGFANQCYFWTTNPQTLAIKPPGSVYFGSRVMKPADALTALKNLVIYRERNQVEGLKIISENNLPELVEALGLGKQSLGPVSTEGTGAKIRFSYSVNGIPMDEEIYGVVEQVKFASQSMFGIVYNIWWYLNYVFSFKSESGKLEENSKIFQAMTSTFRINQHWQAKYNNVVEYLARQQVQQIHNIGEFSRTLSRMSDEMRSDQLQQFEQRSGVYDKVAQQFSDNILGIGRYYDPFEEKEVELPGGYDHVWCNNLGEYVMTDNPNFNPNVGSNLTWKPIEKNKD